MAVGAVGAISGKKYPADLRATGTQNRPRAGLGGEARRDQCQSVARNAWPPCCARSSVRWKTRSRGIARPSMHFLLALLRTNVAAFRKLVRRMRPGKDCPPQLSDVGTVTWRRILYSGAT